jgi:transcriptional regulator with XRE-family HTH domain
MMIADDPALARRLLRNELRAARTKAGLTRDEAVDELDWSLSKLVRIETGEQGVSVTDLRAMLGLYKVTDKTKLRQLEQLARESRRPAWWSKYHDVISKQFGQYLGYEGSAAKIRTFHPMLVPGLLHTQQYAAELLSLTKSSKQTAELVRLRMERQERFFGQERPPEARFIFGEEALIRLIGGPSIMLHQMQYLLEVAENPGVTIQIVPLDVGAYTGLIGPFNLLDLEETEEVLLFLESAAGDFVSRDDQDLISQFSKNFGTIARTALDQDETRELIERRIAELQGAELHRAPRR